MRVLREGDQTKVQRDKKHANMRDYSMKHLIKVEWDLNRDGIRDQIFKLSIDDVEVLIDAQEMLRYLRWV